MCEYACTTAYVTFGNICNIREYTCITAAPAAAAASATTSCVAACVAATFTAAAFVAATVAAVAAQVAAVAAQVAAARRRCTGGVAVAGHAIQLLQNWFVMWCSFECE